MKAAEIRQKFLEYFSSKGHEIVHSSSLVPYGDPTLLFTNAGMNQFKDIFLGLETSTYSRATTSQKCVRAGGKHNDLENVGYTARHHTFFEMLGNFSFGDYFKRDAIQYAWELLTEVFKLPEDKLWVTVYADDDEAYDLWTRQIGIPPDRVIRIGDNKGGRYLSDNFWMMGDTGPCGPCTEIFYDHGESIPGGPPGSPDEDGDRFVEIWNNVFMQFNRDEEGKMHPLPKPSVDTGMGLERMAAILQKVHNNYETDLFAKLIAAAARETQTQDTQSASLKVLADHIRASAFLIADGINPGNEGRGYVLRRIIRRAIRHGYKLGARAPFFYRLVPDLVLEMGQAYPELKNNQKHIVRTLRQEEERFFTTIEHGMTLLEAEISTGQAVLDGELAFKLHDTFGFPLDLTADVCREHSITVDTDGFDAAMALQKLQARAAGKFKQATALAYHGAPTKFLGYTELKVEHCKILALYKGETPVKVLADGETGTVVLDQTPYYAESGGQVGDHGELHGQEGIFCVEDTQKIQASVFGHHGVVSAGSLSIGQTILAQVDELSRKRIECNHSATHLVHKALRDVLGDHVQQKGSLVDAQKTRFDFTHHTPMSLEEIRHVEYLVNQEIFSNMATHAQIMTLEEAQKSGAMMLFDEKYTDQVRVLDIASSRELCGGTHASHTGDIGLFKIISESGVAAGIRRIEGITREIALEQVQTQVSALSDICTILKSKPNNAAHAVSSLHEEKRNLEKEIAKLKNQLAATQSVDIASKAIQIGDHKVLATTLADIDVTALRHTADRLRDQLKSAVIVLATVSDGKVSLIAGITSNLTEKIKAGELVNFVAQQVGGKGGGKPDMAQAGGNQPEKLSGALASVESWVREKLH